MNEYIINLPFLPSPILCPLSLCTFDQPQQAIFLIIRSKFPFILSIHQFLCIFLWFLPTTSNFWSNLLDVFCADHATLLIWRPFSSPILLHLVFFCLFQLTVILRLFGILHVRIFLFRQLRRFYFSKLHPLLQRFLWSAPIFIVLGLKYIFQVLSR